ncbi:MULTISPECIES: hypothetical protein [Thiomicrorhabdus]|uniref:Tryptophan synthase subunit beta like protein n=1 Tax=Thiomicrorhabdus heinhorstiae TaxID=2748010 RepID=A0ABS0BZK5_9GAMM|nr:MULTISPECIES: hypothetical protein [Thiomicrorhabdus]MBF6058899.1 hypothetical protein [Thiomicrorhabdus heinhorstiae]
MVYIERNVSGSIERIEFDPADNREEISFYDPELKEFLENMPDREATIKKILDKLDLDMVRVIEDLIEILIDKNLMLFTDLPEPVQNKLMFKKAMRSLNRPTRVIYEETDEIQL